MPSCWFEPFVVLLHYQHFVHGFVSFFQIPFSEVLKMWPDFMCLVLCQALVYPVHRFAFTLTVFDRCVFCWLHAFICISPGFYSGVSYCFCVLVVPLHLISLLSHFLCPSPVHFHWHSSLCQNHCFGSLWPYLCHDWNKCLLLQCNWSQEYCYLCLLLHCSLEQPSFW